MYSKLKILGFQHDLVLSVLLTFIDAPRGPGKLHHPLYVIVSKQGQGSLASYSDILRWEIDTKTLVLHRPSSLQLGFQD